MSHRFIVSVRHTPVAHSNNTNIQITRLHDLQTLFDRPTGPRPEMLHPANNYLQLRQSILNLAPIYLHIGEGRTHENGYVTPCDWSRHNNYLPRCPPRSAIAAKRTCKLILAV